MDESHLNAPTVHGNTADLPTALASIYRFDGIPMALRAQLSRATLAALFAELARLGWIRAVCGIDQFALDPEHWRNLLTPDYRRVGPVYDVMLGEAAFGRLQPHPGQA